jgi:hypothetical protein
MIVMTSKVRAKVPGERRRFIIQGEWYYALIKATVNRNENQLCVTQKK